jgi:hypothetical protein
MSLIASSGGVNRIPANWYGAAGGVSRKLQSIYGAAQGANRKLFSGAITWTVKYNQPDDANYYGSSNDRISFSARGFSSIRAIMNLVFSEPIYVSSIDLYTWEVYYFPASYGFQLDSQGYRGLNDGAKNILLNKELSKVTFDCEYEGAGRVEGVEFQMLIHSRDYGKFYLNLSGTSDQ